MSKVKKNISFLPTKKINILEPNQLKSMDESLALSNFFSIFGRIQDAIQFVKKGVKVEGKRAYRYFSEHYCSYHLKKALEQGCRFVQGTRAKEEQRELSNSASRLVAELRTQSSEQVTSDFLSDETQLKTLSYLRSSSFSPAIDEEVFETVFHGKGHYRIDVLKKLVSYVKAFLPRSFVEASCFSAIDQAIIRDSDFRKQVAKGKTRTCEERKEELLALAKEMMCEVKSLRPGQSYLAFGGVSHKTGIESPLIDSILSSFLPKNLHTLLKGESSEEVMQNLTDRLKKTILGDIDVSSIVGKRIEQAIRTTFSAAKYSAETILPEKLLNGIKNSLQKDLEEILLGTPLGENAESIGEKIWEDLKTKGLEKVIQESLLEVLQKSRTIVEAQMEMINENVMSALPVAARPILSASGFPKGKEESIWFEFKKQENGKFKLTLFAEGSAAVCNPTGKAENKEGIQLPLTYSDIEFDEAFFYALLYYRAASEWDPDVTFSIQNIHEGLIASLKKDPDKPTDQTLVSMNELQGEGVWKYLFLYLRHQIGGSFDEFEKLYSYEIRLQAFVQMWQRVQSNQDYLTQNPVVAQRLKVAVSELTDQGIMLYQRKQLSGSELKALYATVWEAEKTLHVEVAAPKTASSVIVPPDLQKMAKKLVLAIGISPTQISLIKEALMVVYGTDIEDVVDQVFHDVLPTLTTDEINETHAKRSIDSLYTLEGIKKTANELRNFRFSLLHFIRLYANFSKVVSDICNVSIASYLVEILLLAFCPDILAYSMVSVGALSKLLVFFGPIALKPILPDPIYQGVRAAYRLIQAVITYVQRRITFVIIRIIVRLLLGAETASKLSAQARRWSQKVTRSGELSYSIPYGKNHVGNLRVYSVEAPMASLSKESAEDNKPKIERKITPYDATSELPRPYAVELTKENLNEELSKWILEAQVLGNDQGLARTQGSRNYQRLLYINRQFRNLKLPHQTVMWDEVDAIETMKLLKQVVESMGEFVTEQPFSADERAEVVTTTYTAYALMDHLARRSKESTLPEDLQANGCDLASYLQSPATRVIYTKTYDQLKETAHYFGFDLEKVYTEKEIDQHRTKCLFNYDGRGESWFVPAFGKGEFDVSYLGFRFSKEGKYYRKLLQNPSIRKKLEKNENWQPEISEWEQFKILFDSSADILPKEFVFLRDMDHCARCCITHGKLSTKNLEMERLDSENWFPFAGKITKCFHFFTAGLLRNQTFQPKTIHGELSSKQFTSIHKDDLQSRIYKRGMEHIGDRSKVQLIASDSRDALLLRRKARTVNQVMAEDPLKMKDVSPHEARLLELINSDKEDQIMQTIGFFRRNIGRLREPRFRVLFDLYLNRLGTLQVHLKQNTSLTNAVGAFFKDVLEHFNRQEDIETCLFLAKIGQEIQEIVGSIPKGIFPDFCGYLRFRLIPHLRKMSRKDRTWEYGDEEGPSNVKKGPVDQDLIIISYYHLILSYRFMSPDVMKEETRKQAIEDMARLVYTCLSTKNVSIHSKPDVMVKAEEVLFLWEPYIEKAMRDDPVLRKEVIESILRDVGMGSMIDREDQWTGSYPVFSNGQITIDLIQNTQTAHKVSMDLAYRKASEVTSNPGIGVRLTERAFSFPSKKIIVEFPEGTYQGEAPVVIYRQFAGVDYEYIPCHRRELLQEGIPFSLGPGLDLWMERSRVGRQRHLLCMKGEQKIWRRPIRKSKDENGSPIFKVSWNQKKIDGVPVREVDLCKEPHGLSLLSWFEDESKIKAYAHASHPDQLAFIEMPGRGLRFEVQEHGGDLQAMALGDATGYFLSKMQRNEHLLKYGRYLLMENAQGRKKVYIATKPLKSLMADFIISSIGKIKASPLIEHYINAFTPDIVESQSKLLSFDLDQKGNLTTSDPIGLAYLTLFNFIRGDPQTSFGYFSQVEEYGKKHPFPSKMYQIFELMYLPLLCRQDRFSREMVLRLGAIQSENQLIQHSEEKGKTTTIRETSKTVKLLRWILLQVKYSEYLKAVKNGVPPALNDFQELFLLTEMGRINQTYYNDYVGVNTPESLWQIRDQVGFEHIANTFLFFPEVMERYHQLRLQLDEDSGVFCLSRGLVIQAMNAVFNQSSKGKAANQRQSVMQTGLSRLTHAIEQVKNSVLVTSAIYDIDIPTFYKNVDVYSSLANIPTAIWEFDKEKLTRYFPLYYRLARNERSWGMDKILFNKKRKELLHSLELVQGQFSKEEMIRREILQVVSRGSNLFTFPSASQLESAILEMQKAKKDHDMREQQEFQAFLKENLLSACRQAQFAHQVVEVGVKNKKWNIVKSGIDIAIFLPPESLVPPWLEAGRCAYEMARFTKAAVKREPNIIERGLRLAVKVSSVSLQLLFPQYWMAISGLKTIPWLSKAWTLKRSIQREQTRRRIPSEAVTSRARSILKEKPLEKNVADVLKQRDAAINRVFNDLFDEFYDGEPVPLPIDPNPIELYKIDLEDATLSGVFQEINMSLLSYYNRAPENQFRVQLKQGKDPQEFVDRVQELTHCMAQHLKEEEDKIVEFVQRGKKQSVVDDGTQIIHQINRHRFDEESLSFEQIYGLFVRADDEAFLKKTELSPDLWENIKTRLYLYQVVRRRFNMLFNQVDQMKKGEFNRTDQLALELKRRPAYDLGQDVPELVLRSKLSYEVALEFMLYETALQSCQLDRLLLTQTQKATSEQIMGTGKTFLLPISDRVYADGKTIVCNTVIDPVAPVNFRFFTRSTKKAFGQDGSILRFNRSMTWETKELWALRLMLRRVLHLGEHINARQKDWQALELRMLEESLDINGEFVEKYGRKTWELRQQYYWDCLGLLKDYGLENSDEKDKLDDPTSNILNFPLGQSLTLQNEEVQIMNEIVLLLVTTPDFKDYITIKSKRPEKLPLATYIERIQGVLSERIAALDILGIEEKARKAFAAYLRGDSKCIPNFIRNSPRRRAIGQAKGCNVVLLKHVLQSVINVAFTVSKQGNGEYTRPAGGNDDPLEDSTNLKPDITYLQTLMRLLQVRLSAAQMEKLINSLHEEATEDATHLGQHKQETPAGRFFALYCPGYQIDTYKESDLPRIMEMLNKSDRAMTLYATRFIAKDIKFYKSFLSSNFANFHSIFGKGERSRTGTPKNRGCYPPKTEILAHPGTEGESVHVLEKKIGPNSIHVLEESDPKPALREVIYRFFQPNRKVLALIDLDPLCNNMSAEAINEEFQRYIKDHRPELQGVTFYDKDKNLVVAERGSKKPVPYEESNIPKNRRISVFTHTQTTGSDIPQDDEAEAILTIGENITLTDLAQAFDRMRKARRGNQQITIVMTKRAQQRICKRLGKSGEYVPTIREIIRISAVNEHNKLDPHYYLAARYLLHDIVRNAIREKARQQPTIQKKVDILRKFKHIFVIEVETDPFEAYGYIDIEMDPKAVLSSYRNSMCRLVADSGLFTRNEIEKIKQELKSVRIDHAVQKVHMYQKNGNMQSSDELLSQHAHQSQAESTASEVCQDAEVDIDTHLHVNQNATNPSEPKPIYEREHQGYLWPEDLDLYNIDHYFNVVSPKAWKLSSPVPIYPLRDFLQLRKDLVYLGDSLSNAIYVTENFAQQRDNRWLGRASAVKPLGEKQTPLYKALVIQDRRKGQLDQKILLLHKDEEPFWRNKLEKNKVVHPGIRIALYDFGTRTFLGDEIEKSADFTNAITQIKFLNAELNYSSEEQMCLLAWMHSVGTRHMRQTFETLHKERPVGCYSGSDIQTLFYNASGVPIDMRIRV